MNLVRLHYADGSVESYRGDPRDGFPSTIPSRPGTVEAVTDGRGEVVGSMIFEELRSLARWSQGRLDADRLARNIARVRAEERAALVAYQPESFLTDEEVADEEPFEHKADGAWLAIAVVGVLILAVMVGTAVGSVGS